MTTAQISTRIAALTPLLVMPILAVALIHLFDGVPSGLKGFITGLSIVMLLGYCFVMGILLRAQRDIADREKLEALDPLGDLPRGDEREGDR